MDLKTHRGLNCASCRFLTHVIHTMDIVCRWSGGPKWRSGIYYNFDPIPPATKPPGQTVCNDKYEPIDQKDETS